MAYEIMAVYNVNLPVGPGQPNRPDDVKLVQTMLIEVTKALLEDWDKPPTPLMCDGRYSENLRQWIIAFQKRAAEALGGKIAVDGKVDPMPMKGKFDWSSTIGNVKSTMFELNVVLHKGARSAHSQIGVRLALPSSDKYK